MTEAESPQTSRSDRLRENLKLHENAAHKERALSKKTPSQVRSIANALTMKNNEIYFVCEQSGEVPHESNNGYGLYFHDCRYLETYTIRFQGKRADHIGSMTEKGFFGQIELSNPDMCNADGKFIVKESCAVRWERLLDGQTNSLRDTFHIHNYSGEALAFDLSFGFQANFDDLFVVRGMTTPLRGRLEEPRWVKDDVLFFEYEGLDRIWRSVSIHFSRLPDLREKRGATFHISLHAGQESDLTIVLDINESIERSEVQPCRPLKVDRLQLEQRVDLAAEQWFGQLAEMTCDSLLFKNTFDTAKKDLFALLTAFDGDRFFAAGVPWFSTLFGRDSCVTAIQTLAFSTEIAEQTLRLLAKYQGKECNEWRDEQPGKILHEFRQNELTHIGDLPYSPYYGTVDATPLFLMLFAKHAAWKGSLELFNELQEAVEAALTWIDKYGDSDGDGFIDYRSSFSEKGLVNKGWKDSGNAIMNADGTLAKPPIALAEVQGYVYEAKLGIADLYERSGNKANAETLRKDAKALRDRFNEKFWLKDLGFYALALQEGGKPCEVVASNPGQALWSGIVNEERAPVVAKRLMRPDLFSGWGIRTLSDAVWSYNPIGYHVGTVWPHDNSLIAAGLKRYGFDRESFQIHSGLFHAALSFSDFRMPELFSGFSRKLYHKPVHYPVACHPQAWGAGSILFSVQTLLGLHAEGFDGRLRIVRPALPDMVDRLDLTGVRVGQASVDLGFERNARGEVDIHITSKTGHLDIVLEQEPVHLAQSS